MSTKTRDELHMDGFREDKGVRAWMRRVLHWEPAGDIEAASLAFSRYRFRRVDSAQG